MSTPFKMKGPSLYNSPLTKKTPGGATLIKTGKKQKDSTVKDAIQAAKDAPSESESANVVVPTNRTKVEKPKSEREHYKNIPGFN